MLESSKRFSRVDRRGGQLAANASLPPERLAATHSARQARIHLPAPSLRVHTFAR
jgi:hypothetical protein